MKKHWTISQEAFDKFLNWLDEDVEKAGRMYQRLREKLIKMFVSRGFSDAEDLADEVFNRVISKIETLSQEYVGEKSTYFYGVALKIVLEAKRRKETPLNEEIHVVPLQSVESDSKVDCLDECLKKLPDDQHKLILSYYESEKRAKIEQRNDLARQFSLNMNSLRVQVCRIRSILKECIEECSVKV